MTLLISQYLDCRFICWHRKRLEVSLLSLWEWRRAVPDSIRYFAGISGEANVFHGSSPRSVFSTWPSCCLEAVSDWQRNRVRNVYIVVNCCHILQRDYGILPALHICILCKDLTVGKLQRWSLGLRRWVRIRHIYSFKVLDIWYITYVYFFTTLPYYQL